MIQIYNVGNKEKNTCCGCTACLDLCPKKAIRMEVDDQGFKYPTVNQSLCNDCGEKSIASKLEFGGKIIIMTMSFPILLSIVDTIISLI